MTRSAKIELEWAGGDYVFRLPIGQLIELQDACDAGPEWIWNALHDGSYRFEYIRETIRLGLIGGGMDPIPALKLVKRYVDDRPLAENKHTAALIMGAVVVGIEGDPLPKPGGEAEAAEEAASPDQKSDGAITSKPAAPPA